mgnify:CR=1 FL=1
MRQTCVIVLFFLSLFSSAHADETIANGLTLKIPSPGQRNWDVLFRDEFAEPISSHDHTGSGNGVQLGTGSFSSNAISGAKIRLANDEYLRARNAANSADLNICKANASNKIIFDVANVDASTRTSLGAAASGTNSDITSLTALTWTTYAPTASGDGTNTLSGVSTTRATYFKAGTFVCVSLEFTGTLSGSLSDKIAVTLPFNSATPYGGNMAVGMGAVAGTSLYANPNTLHLYRYDATNLANGAYTFRVNGCYEAV